MNAAVPAALCLWMLGAATVSAAQEPAEEAFALAALNPYAISPDGSRLAFVRCPSRLLDRRGCAIFVGSSAGGREAISVGKHDAAWSPRWSPDGRFLAYFAIDGALGGLWVLDVADGSRHALWRAASPQQGLDQRSTPYWADEGRALLFMHQVAAPERPRADDADMVRVKHTYPQESPPVWASGAAVENLPSWTVVRLEWAGRVPAGDGAERLRLEGVPTSFVGFSSDGQRVAYLERTEPPMAVMRKGRYALEHRLLVRELRTGSTRILAEKVLQYIGGAGALRWSPDGRWIAFASGDRFAITPYAPYDVMGELSVVPSDGSAPAVSIGGIPAGGISVNAIGMLLWTADSRYVVARSEDGAIVAADVRLHRMRKLDRGPMVCADSVAVDSRRPEVAFTQGGALLMFGIAQGNHDGYVQRVPLSSGSGRALHRAPVRFPAFLGEPRANVRSGRVYFEQQSIEHGRDIWSADLSFKSVRRETTLGESPAVPMRGEVIAYPGPDGQTLLSAVRYPPGYDAARRYPVLLWVYPNGEGSLAVNLHHITSGTGFELEQLVLRGYVVVSPDMPCPVNCSMETMDALAQAAADALVARGIADPRRIGVMGSSAGGYATLALLSTSQRWRVGIMNAGYGDLTDLWGYLGSDEIYDRAGFLPLQEFWSQGSPWEQPDAYVSRSPLYRLDRVKAPIFIQAGARDGLFHRSSNSVYAGLVRAGHTQVTSVVYVNEGHHVGEARAHRDYWNRVAAFLEANL